MKFIRISSKLKNNTRQTSFFSCKGMPAGIIMLGCSLVIVKFQNKLPVLVCKVNKCENVLYSQHSGSSIQISFNQSILLTKIGNFSIFYKKNFHFVKFMPKWVKSSSFLKSRLWRFDWRICAKLELIKPRPLKIVIFFNETHLFKESRNSFECVRRPPCLLTTTIYINPSIQIQNFSLVYNIYKWDWPLT